MGTENRGPAAWFAAFRGAQANAGTEVSHHSSFKGPHFKLPSSLQMPRRVNHNFVAEPE